MVRRLRRPPVAGVTGAGAGAAVAFVFEDGVTLGAAFAAFVAVWFAGLCVELPWPIWFLFSIQILSWCGVPKKP